MHLKDALGSQRKYARINSLKHIQGLNDFEVTCALKEEIPSLDQVVRNYILLLSGVEQRLEQEARERAADRMPPRFVMMMLKKELDPSSYASFRVYGEWILQAIRTFGRSIPITTSVIGRSTVEILKFGLSEHCRASFSIIEARIAEVRTWNSSAFDSDDRFDEGDVIAQGFHDWRLPATTIVTGLIELGSLELSQEEQNIFWNGLSGEDGDWLVGDVILRTKAEGYPNG
jgi:hypothetical protein